MNHIDELTNFLSQLPILNIYPEIVEIDIPWFGQQEMESWLHRNEIIIKQWQQEINSVDSDFIGKSAFLESMIHNYDAVISYVEFPKTFQQYLGWREKYFYEIMANIEAIEQSTAGWLYDNGIRFRNWVETYILIKNILKLWNVIVNLFQNFSTSCEECKNERWNSLYFIFKLVSFIIPPIPIIDFPDWPDIEIDLSYIDLTLDIPYPTFDIDFYPIKTRSAFAFIEWI